MIGTTLGHFRITAKLGAGGMGEVYRARDERLDREVAIKVLPAEVAQDPGRLARFEGEAKALARLSHPNILGIHEFGEDQGVTFVVTELLEGETLRERLGQGAVPWRTAVETAAAIADGLAAAHTQGIVHRDLKPENIFLTSDCRVKILDFGLAQIRLPADREAETVSVTPAGTLPGTVMGTVGYMSPEQVRGEPADARSDIFALGCVLYEMVSGKSAFRRSTSADASAAILKEEPPELPPTGLVRSEELESTVRRCLEKRPEARFQSAADLAYGLRSLSTDHAVQRIPRDDEKSEKGRRTWLWIAAGGVVVALALVALWSRIATLVEETPGHDLPRLVVLPFENLGPPDDAYFAAGMTEELTARLAALQGFRVISRTSAVQYAGSDKTIRQVGEELGVDYALEGSVRWARTESGASRIRVTLQLIRVADDTHLWADAYDRTIGDIFDVQSEIAQKVTDYLGVTVGSKERALLDAQPTTNVEAYQAYLQGRYWSSRPHFTYEDWERRMAAFQRAVELDPDFALAHAELARGHALARYLRHDLSSGRLRAADASAARALALAPGSPPVHLDIGYYRLWAYRDTGAALAEFERAAEARPEDAEAFEAMAQLYLQQGRWDDMITASRRAFALSPRDADAIADAGAALWVTRRYREAIEAFDQAMSIAPETLWPHLYKVFALWSWRGRGAEARRVLEAIPDLEDDWADWAWYWQEMFDGNYEAALGRLESTPGTWIRTKTWARPKALFAAYAYDRLGRTERAAAAVETARRFLVPEVEASPEDPRLHSSLGIVYALQGRREDAIREGRLACDLLPREKDGFYYLPYVLDLAHILTIVGDNDAAIDKLDYLLSNPSWISSPFLRMDPRWGPLRRDPRFEALLARHEVER